MAANAEFVYQKSLRDNPELAQRPRTPFPLLAETAHQTGIRQGRTGGGPERIRQCQDHRISRQESRRERQTGRIPCGTALERGAADRRRGPASHAGYGRPAILHRHVWQHRTGLAATSYLSEDSDMLGAEAAYGALEADLQHELDNYESLHPGYDEYRFDLDEIKHDPMC